MQAEPEGRGLTSAQGTGSSEFDEPEGLIPYLPRLTVGWMATHPEVRWRSSEGTVAFLDVSGFTRLSEQLSRRGKVGAEDLTDVINNCFACLLGLAAGQGGSLIKFGGDALLTWFNGSRHAERACTAAYEMRRALRDVGRVRLPGGRVALKMSVGIHSGVFNFFLVGHSHRELVIAGPHATTTVRMEGTASAGEILLSRATAELLPLSCRGEPLGNGILLKRPPPRSVVLDLTEAEAPAAADRALECIPVGLRAHLLAPSREPEHRRATVAFIHFDGTDDLIERQGPEKAAAAIETLVSAVQDSADQHGVTFLGSDVDADGGKMILLAGAPSAFEDDEDRMMRALRGIVDSDLPIPVRIGVNRGDVFTGDVGPPSRRTFTVMGDTVNLAARIMARAAPGEILASRSVLERCRSAVEATTLEPFMVKGKSRPVEAFSVAAVSRLDGDQDAKAELPLVGRDSEIGRFEATVESTAKGSGSLVEIVGEAGLGKTRLLRQLRTIARAGLDDLEEIHRACDAYEVATPYSAMAPVARRLLQVGEVGGDEIPERLRAALGRASNGLAVWAPLFGPLLGIEMADTPETAALDARFRGQRMGLALSEFLVHGLTAPTLVTVEDAHWMDDASSELLGHLAAGASEAPLLICTTRRPGNTGFRAEAHQSVVLGALAFDEATRLVEAATDAQPLGPHIVESLVWRSGGNPLFLTELIRVSSGGAIKSLPESVHGLITARIDRLPPQERHALRQASVLGRSFPQAWLSSLVGDTGLLRRAELDGLLRVDRTGIVEFEHALMRDAAYEGLAYRARRRLHGRAAEIILAAGGAEEGRGGLLSLHYLHAEQFEQAWTHALAAARRAQSMYANLEAAELYERALVAASRLQSVPPHQIAAVQESLGDVRQRFGEYGLAEGAYRAARRRTAGDALTQARLLHKAASAQAWVDDHSRALRTLRRAVRLLEGDESADAGRLRAKVFAAYAGSCEMDGRHRLAVRWCHRAVDVAERHGEKAATADALRWLDWSLSQTGGLDSPANLRRAVELYGELGDLAGQANALNMLGAIAYWHGDWAAAIDSYSEARTIATRSGNTVMAAMFAANIAEILLAQGRLHDIAELLGAASRVSKASGTRSGSSFALVILGRTAAHQGRFEQGLELLDRAISVADESHSMDEALEGRARKAECLLLSGDSDEALRLADTTLAMAESLGGAPQAPLIHRVRAVALARSGQEAAAREALVASLTEARVRGADYDIALSLVAQSQMLRRLGETPPPEVEVESRTILGQLGVVSVPQLFG